MRQESGHASDMSPREDFFDAFTRQPCTRCGGRRNWQVDGQLQAVCHDCGNPPPHGRWVRVSNELVTFLSTDWSEPVRVKIERDDGKELQLLFERVYSA